MKKRMPRRRRKNRLTLLLTVLFWGLSAVTCIAMLGKGIENVQPADIEQEVGKQYLAAAFPTISRGTGFEGREVISEGGIIDSIPVESLIIGNEFQVGMKEDKASEEEEATLDVILDSASLGKPQVLIYHTHATESYQPVRTGNFHSIEEKGTVREVGSVLKGALEARGISVIHDKSIHDSPSYSKSYSRSLESAQKLLASNPSIKIVIDLHRDAAAYNGNVKHTFNTGGNEAAQFCLVVGEGNPNVNELKSFANRINQKANSLYPGFSKGVILKEYKYNQYIADDYILLEMGNNQNDIEEVKRSATMFAQVIADVLKEMM